MAIANMKASTKVDFKTPPMPTADDSPDDIKPDTKLPTEIPPASPNFLAPYNWHLVMDDGELHAVNNVTGDVFRGTHSDFSKMLRGS